MDSGRTRIHFTVGQAIAVVPIDQQTEVSRVYYYSHRSVSLKTLYLQIMFTVSLTLLNQQWTQSDQIKSECDICMDFDTNQYPNIFV